MLDRHCLWVVMVVSWIFVSDKVRANDSATTNSESGPTSVRPNVIVFLADDLGYEVITANGGTSYSTPNIDRLAAGGARYEHCYTQPLCTPTRAQVMTGQLNVRNYVRFGFLDPSQKSFANLLRDNDYATGVFGKWQLSNGPRGPELFGFDEYVLWQLTRRPPRYANPGIEIQGVEKDFKHGEYGPDLIQAAALNFVTKHRDRPFLLYYPMILTHGPFQPTPKSPDWDPEAFGEEVNQDVKHFAEMVAYADMHVGQIIDRLERLKIREHTLIIFKGDNGTVGTITSAWNGRSIRGAKGKTTDAGMRVPLILNWPGMIPAGNVVQDLVDGTDILPTVCDAAGVVLPRGIEFDGQSLLPSACDQDRQSRDWLYCWYWPNQVAPDRTNEPPVEFARTHRYKLYADNRFFELDGNYGEVELDVTTLQAEALRTHQLLRNALSKYSTARPADHSHASP